LIRFITKSIAWQLALHLVIIGRIVEVGFIVVEVVRTFVAN